MGSILTALRRFGPLVASFILGAQAVFTAASNPAVYQALETITNLLGFFGISADATIATGVVAVVTGGVALAGAVYKTYKLIVAAYFSNQG